MNPASPPVKASGHSKVRLQLFWPDDSTPRESSDQPPPSVGGNDQSAAFARLPHSIASDPALRPVDVLIYCAILSHARAAAECSVGNKRLGEYARASRTTVVGALDRLEERGYISRRLFRPTAENATGRIICLSDRVEGDRERSPEVAEIIPPKANTGKSTSNGVGPSTGLPRPVYRPTPVTIQTGVGPPADHKEEIQEFREREEKSLSSFVPLSNPSEPVTSAITTEIGRDERTQVFSSLKAEQSNEEEPRPMMTLDQKQREDAEDLLENLKRAGIRYVVEGTAEQPRIVPYPLWVGAREVPSKYLAAIQALKPVIIEILRAQTPPPKPVVSTHGPFVSKPGEKLTTQQRADRIRNAMSGGSSIKIDPTIMLAKVEALPGAPPEACGELADLMVTAFRERDVERSRAVFVGWADNVRTRRKPASILREAIEGAANYDGPLPRGQIAVARWKESYQVFRSSN